MTKLPSKIYLVDKNPSLVKRWKEVFRDFEEVEVILGEYFSVQADAIVSPANSFGIMDGGIDKVITDHFGKPLQAGVQDMIKHKYKGEMPVGSAEVVATGNPDWPNLIVAPTMRIPQDVAYTLNTYQAFRAVFLAIEAHNLNPMNWDKIDSVVCCGMGSGVGGVTPIRCAGQMRAAYSLLRDPKIKSFKEIHEDHRNLETL